MPKRRYGTATLRCVKYQKNADLSLLFNYKYEYIVSKFNVKISILLPVKKPNPAQIVSGFYSCILSLRPALNAGWWLLPRPGRFTTR